MEKSTYKEVVLNGTRHIIMSSSRTMLQFDMVDFDYDVTNMPKRPMHKHDFYHIIIFYEGSGVQNIDFRNYAVTDNMIFFLSPSQHHSLASAKSARGCVINFSDDFLLYLNDRLRMLLKQSFFFVQKPAPVFAFSCKNMSLIRRRLSGLRLAFSAEASDNPYYSDYISAELTLLLLDILRLSEPNGHDIPDLDHTSAEEHTYFDFIDFVESNYSECHTVASCAEKMGISLSTLNRNVFQVAGERASEILRKRIVLEAKRRLRYQKELNIKEISNRLRFGDPSNFVKFFRNATGETPIAYRDEETDTQKQ